VIIPSGPEERLAFSLSWATRCAEASRLYSGLGPRAIQSWLWISDRQLRNGLHAPMARECESSISLPECEGVGVGGCANLVR
jgi:hypothetical protein